MRRFLNILLTALTLTAASCSLKETGSKDYVTPSIVSSEAIVSGDSVSFTCVLSSPRAEKVGFVYGIPGETENILLALPSGDSFKAIATDLEYGKTYQWHAFATAGNNETKSLNESFTVTGKSPSEEGIYIRDPYFKSLLVERFDIDGDGVITSVEALKVTELRVTTDVVFSLEGIENFKNLETLYCTGWYDEYAPGTHPGVLDSLDLSSNTKLRYLDCSGNMIRSLNVEGCVFLEYLQCGSNLLDKLDVSNCSKLGYLGVGYNRIKAIDLSANTKLDFLDISENGITSFIFPTMLKELVCRDNPISAIDVSKIEGLKRLDVSGSKVSSLFLSGNPVLEDLSCCDCNLRSLLLTCNPKLSNLHCWGNRFTRLDVSRNPLLGSGGEETGLFCYPMQDILGQNLLEYVFVADGQSIPKVTFDRDPTRVPAETIIKTFRPNAIPVEDPAFKRYLISEGHDKDGDGEISLEEAESIQAINCVSDVWNIQSAQGIEFMPNLTYLVIRGTWVPYYSEGLPEHYFISSWRVNNSIDGGPVGTLKRIDVSYNYKLHEFNVGHNEGLGETQGTIDLSQNAELTSVCVNYCRLGVPDVSHLGKLISFSADGDMGSFPDFSGCKELVELCLGYVEGCDSDIDLSNHKKLEKLSLSGFKGKVSGIEELSRLKILIMDWSPNSGDLLESEVPSLTNLEELSLHGSNIDHIELSKLVKLVYLNVGWDSIKSLDVSNNLLLGSKGNTSGSIYPLQCTPMDGLETIYVAPGQVIPYVTENRSDKCIPSGTRIVVKQD